MSCAGGHFASRSWLWPIKPRELRAWLLGGVPAMVSAQGWHFLWSNSAIYWHPRICLLSCGTCHLKIPEGLKNLAPLPGVGPNVVGTPSGVHLLSCWLFPPSGNIAVVICLLYIYFVFMLWNTQVCTVKDCKIYYFHGNKYQKHILAVEMCDCEGLTLHLEEELKKTDASDLWMWSLTGGRGPLGKSEKAQNDGGSTLTETLPFI